MVLVTGWSCLGRVCCDLGLVRQTTKATNTTRHRWRLGPLDDVTATKEASEGRSMILQKATPQTTVEVVVVPSVV